MTLFKKAVDFYSQEIRQKVLFHYDYISGSEVVSLIMDIE